MPVEPRRTPPASGYADREPTKPPNWHGLVAWDMFLNAVSTGLFLSAALGELALAPVLSPVTTWAYPVAVAVLFGDHLCLILDLGNPARFHHMLRVFKPLSPMSLGTWVLAAYSVPLTVAGSIDVGRFLGLLPIDSTAINLVRMAAVAAAIPFAFATAAYKGVLFSTTAQPGWRDARWLGGYHISSALAFGAGGHLALATLAGFDRAVEMLRPAVVALHLVGLVPLTLVSAEMWPALRRRYSPAVLALVGGLAYPGGVLLPVAAAAVGGKVMVVVGGAFALAAGLAVRYAIVFLPHRHDPAA